MQRDSVVGPDGLHLDAERVAQPRCDRHGPRRVHARAEGSEDAETPIADLVAEPLDDNGSIRRHRTRRGGLLVEELHQVARGPFVKRVLLLQARQRLGRLERDELARRPTDRLAELVRTADSLALPKRDRTRHARSG